MTTIVFTPADLDRYVALKINEALDKAYTIARGAGLEDRFKTYGTAQLYWKGRSEAAADIRAFQERVKNDANRDSSSNT